MTTLGARHTGLSREETSASGFEVSICCQYPVAANRALRTVRFHALRLHGVGMIKASPQKIIAQAPIDASSTSWSRS